MAIDIGGAPPGVSADEMAELHLMEAAIGGRSLIEFVPRVSPRMPGGVDGVAPWHLLRVAEAFAQAEYEPVRVALSVPPRHGKTELLLHAISWWMSRHADHTVAYASYAAEFAQSKNVRAREIAVASGVPLPGGRSRAGYWSTSIGGGVMATGVGGPLTGHGANLLIIDDPVKNREEAESATYRQKTWEWFTSTALTRVTPGGSVIVVHTRWHQDDLIGRIAKARSKIPWQVINLPALGPTGDPLWPEGGWDADAMDAKRVEVGDYDWNALYMGDPRPRGGRMFNEPAFYDMPVITGGARIVISCDPAATAKTHADYSVVAVGSCYLDADGEVCIDLLDVIRMQVEIPRLVTILTETTRAWRAPVIIESVGGFKGVSQSLREMARGVRIVEIYPTSDKFTRALPLAAAWNGGRIRLPRPETKPWVNTLLDEFSIFSGVADPHDDQVDAVAHMLNAARQFIAAVRPDGDTIAAQLPFG